MISCTNIHAHSQVRRIDAQLDRLQLTSQSLTTGSTSSTSSSTTPDPTLLPSVTHLQTLVKSLSLPPSARNPLLSSQQLQRYLLSANLPTQEASISVNGQPAAEGLSEYENELQWLLVSKAVTQVYGIVLSKILDDTVMIAQDIYYWDEVLSSQTYTALYSVQISPLRLYDWTGAVWEDVRRRSSSNLWAAGQDAGKDLSEQWRQFYGLVKEVIRERNVMDMQRRVVSPVARIRTDIRAKQGELRRARLRGANALGVLLGEGLMNESVHGEGLSTPPTTGDQATSRKWKVSMARNVALMDAVLAKVNERGLTVDKFDAAIAEETDEDPLYDANVQRAGDGDGSESGVTSGQVAHRLLRTLTTRVPEFEARTKGLVQEHGRPSVIVRYWLPVTIGVLSSSTVLRILLNRKAEVITWIEELGATIIDFWRNWVVEPTRKLIGTIHHDEASEVSIMSKRSLEGDRDSLERMVVDFAIDKPQYANETGAKLTDTEIADIRLRVREGDLTPVLKAYEKDLQSPITKAVTGNLVRTLLIQVQKTKVDVEVAMRGIDDLLKSQELVFGFVGLTPGVLVTVALVRWFRQATSRRRGSDRARKQGVMVRQLRNIDRVLTNSTPTEFGELFYKDHGLLLCEVHLLRQEAKKSMPQQVYREFIEEVEELVDVRMGVKRQQKVVDRMRWAYARWL